MNPEDTLYANALAVKKMISLKQEQCGTLPAERYYLNAYAEKYRYIDGELRLVSQPGYMLGQYNVGDYWNSLYLFSNLCGVCDGYLPPHGLVLGETYTATDGKSTLTHEADGRTVETPAGIFENCQLWTVCTDSSTVQTYLREGVGIVRQERIVNGKNPIATHLTAYKTTGEGLLPFTAGNKWSYAV